MNLLIDCPHCQTEVSMPANVPAACPNCGQPVVANEVKRSSFLQQVSKIISFRRFCIIAFFVSIWSWVAWLVFSQPSDESPTPRHTMDSQRVSNISNAELQSLIADVYKVETSRFIQPDLLWITLPPLADEQKTCQAIANVWASRSGRDYVRVECWRGSQRLGQGTVQFGQIRTP